MTLLYRICITGRSEDVRYALFLPLMHAFIANWGYNRRFIRRYAMSTSQAINFIDMHAGKLRAVSTAIGTIIGLYMLALLVSTVHIDSLRTDTKPQTNSQQTVSANSNEPNAITGGAADASVALSNGLDRTGVALSQTTRSAAVGVVRSANYVVRTGVLVGHGVQHSAAYLGRGLAHGVGIVVSVPGAIISAVSRATDVNEVIKPVDYSSIPVIEPAPGVLLTEQAKALLTAPTPSVATAPAQNVPTDSAGVWPIHGTVTTLFGVPELPYQAIHTGLDISDGKRPGVTPVVAFKPGTVAQVIHSSAGLGNHIVVDHGGGVTSVYGHLYSTAVQVGQQVNQQTILGLEGTTGVSTGTHLHFEIWVNGQPNDPHKFISGQP